MATFPMISSVAEFIKMCNPADKVNIDNVVFRAHYKFTTTIIFGCFILVIANNLIGEPISCMTDRIPAYIMNAQCLASDTFTLPDKFGKCLGTHVAHPGVSSYIENEDHVQYYSYYQWVELVLLLQGVMFYAPHWLWKKWEQGTIRMMTDGVRDIPIGQFEETTNQRKQLVQRLIDTLHMHNLYALGYFFCEVLNFLNVVGNMFLIDRFLGGAFFTYGIKVLEFSQMDQNCRYDPMVVIFPKVIKCTFKNYGPSGTIQTHDGLCVLPFNVLNEKLFIFLWFWFITLAIVSGLTLAYSIAVMTLPSFRKAILLRRFKYGPPQSVSALVQKTPVGDFLLLLLLGQNMNILHFTEVLDDFGSRLHLGNHFPTTPSTLELSPIRVYKETEA